MTTTTPHEQTQPDRSISALFKFGLVGFLVLGILALLAWRTFGAAEMGVTLTTNPDLERGLVGHWTFDGEYMDWSSTTAEVRDRTPTASHGNAVGGMTTSSAYGGVLGQALSLDGQDDYVALSPALLNGRTTASVAFWLQIDAQDTDLSAFSCYGSTEFSIWHNFNNWWSLYVAASGTPVIYMSDSFGWKHFVATYDGGTGAAKLYLNGSVISEGTLDTGPLTCTALDVGRTFAGSYGYNRGVYDDVRIYSRVLSADDVKRIYGLGATTHVAETITTNPNLESGLVGHWTFDGEHMDWSSTTGEVRNRASASNQGNASGGMSSRLSAAPGPLGQALAFDGLNDSVSVGDSTALKPADLTVSAWVKPRNYTCTGPDLNCQIFAKYYFWQGYQMYISPNDSRAYFHAYNGQVAGGSSVSTMQAVPLGVWTHLVASRDNGAISMYMNGERMATETTQTLVHDGTEATIGSASWHSGNYFNGAIDDVRVYSRSLSPDEVKRLYGLGASTRVSETITTSGSDTTAPSTPVGLTAQGVSNRTVNLRWATSTDAQTGVAGYTVYRNGAAVGTSSTLAYSDTGLAAGTSYTYTVDAYDAAGNHSTVSVPAAAETRSDASYAVAAPIPPSPYTVPAGAIRVTNTAELLTALSNNTNANIVLADGTYDHNTYFRACDNKLWSENLLGATLTAGVEFGGNWCAAGGGELHGITFDVATDTKTLHSAIVHAWGAGPGNITIQDSVFRGNWTLWHGLLLYLVENNVIERNEFYHFRDTAVRISNTAYTGHIAYGEPVKAMRHISDIYVDGVSRATPGESNGTGEMGLWVGNPVTNGVERIKVRNVSWTGINVIDNPRDTVFRDLDIDMNGQFIAAAVPVYLEHWSYYNEFSNFWLRGKHGFVCEWDDPAWGGTPGCRNNLIHSGVIDGVGNWSNSIGINLDQGTYSTTVRHVRFVGQAKAAINLNNVAGVNDFTDNDFTGILPGALPIKYGHPTYD